MRDILLNEMISRVVKIDIRRSLRDEMEKTGLSSVEPYKQIVLNQFNYLLEKVFLKLTYNR